jgi:hypothetical protein
VEFAVSDDGQNFRIIGISTNDIPPEKEGAIRKDFSVSFQPIQSRFVRIKAKNRKKCPSWHEGADNKAWIFADEIVIE